MSSNIILSWVKVWDNWKHQKNDTIVNSVYDFINSSEKIGLRFLLIPKWQEGANFTPIWLISLSSTKNRWWSSFWDLKLHGTQNTTKRKKVEKHYLCNFVGSTAGRSCPYTLPSIVMVSILYWSPRLIRKRV